MINQDESALYKDLTSVLITREQIARRVSELGLEITREYEGKELVCVCILKGAALFFSDIIRSIDLPISIDFMSFSSYGSASESSGVVRILKDLDRDIVGKHCLVIEDIVDTGLTLSFMQQNLSTRGAKSLKVCTLLDKPARRKVELTPDYTGFVVEDHFVVGYGLDFDQKYRNLPDIGILRPNVYSK